MGLRFVLYVTKKPSNGSSELDIFWPGRAFYFYKVPFVIIWGFKTANDANLNSSTVWQGGVQFGELRPDQISQLEYFIQNHTTDEV